MLATPPKFLVLQRGCFRAGYSSRVQQRHLGAARQDRPPDTPGEAISVLSVGGDVVLGGQCAGGDEDDSAADLDGVVGEAFVEAPE